MIAMTDVQSTNLKAFGYDPASQPLAVRFAPGKVYHYTNVPADLAKQFAEAESKGKAFASMVRGKFEHTVVLDEPDDAAITTKDGAVVDTAKPWQLPAEV